MRIFLLLIFFHASSATAKETLCDILNLPNCAGVNKVIRRSSVKSLPSSGSSTQFNPANVSHDRGFGIETFVQPANSVNFTIVTGTGRMGAALFKNKQFDLDLGHSGKYTENIRRFNPGAGITMRLGPLSVGASQYLDDVFLRTNTFGLGENYQEQFYVQTIFVGLKMGLLFLDAGTMSSHFSGIDEKINTRLFSAAFIYQKFLFNFALREEESGLKKINDGVLISQRQQQSKYLGLQYAAHKLLVFGVHYNFYLLDETSASMTVFF